MFNIAPKALQVMKRPPTPPRESSAKQADDGAFFSSTASRPLLDTPEESPSSSAEYFRNSSGKRVKKVEFDLFAPSQKAAAGLGLKAYADGLRQPPSRECNPSRSILKSSIEKPVPSSSDNLLSNDYTNLPAMLRSTVQHLASESRASRLDGYTSLLGCLSAHEDVPEAKDLSERVGEISGYMKRDIIARLPDGKSDSQLAAQVLKLATVFLYTKGMETLLPEEFCCFMLDQALASLEDDYSPKILVLHYLHFVEKQKFSTRVMSLERQERLITALSQSTVRAKGNRIICHRLNIYLRLITQAKPAMVLRVEKWMDHLVTGLLSTAKEIRARAIAFGLEASLHLGTIGSVSQECTNLFNRSPPGGEKFVHFFCTRLMELVRSKEEGVHVPQIWSVILLFFRSRRRQVETWEHLKTWLQVLQTCLNSHDPQIKFQANLAWNRLIFAVNIEASTSVGMARMLKQPIVLQLERKSEDKASRMAKQVARSSYCTLLYYAFRPTSSHVQIDQYWELYIAEILPKQFKAGRSDRNYACEILAALLYAEKLPKFWDENKANANGPTKSEDLLPIDSKWIRSNTGKVLQVFEETLAGADWQAKEKVDAPLLTLWSNFTSALGLAGSKEIKVSTEAIVALAGTMNLFKRIIQSGKLGVCSVADCLENFHTLFDITVAKIGHITFNDRRLCLGSTEAYEAVGETPTARSRSKKTCVDSATGHLLALLLQLQSPPNCQEVYNSMKSVIQVHLQGLHSRQSRIKSLSNLSARISDEQATQPKPSASIFWSLLAENLVETLQLPRNPEGHNVTLECLGNDYQDILLVLQTGLGLGSSTVFSPWQALYRQLSQTARSEIGDTGFMLAIQEPLAQKVKEIVVESCDDFGAEVALLLLADYQQPSNLNALQKTSTLVWELSTAAPHACAVEACSNIQQMMNSLLESMYLSNANIVPHLLLSCIDTASRILRECLPGTGISFLVHTQHGLAAWMRDRLGLMRHQPDLLEKVDELHMSAMQLLENSDKESSELLIDFQTIISSCLSSRHELLVDKTIKWWNETLGRSSALVYPEALIKLLFKLKAQTSICLPNFPDIHDQALFPIESIESQEAKEDFSAPGPEISSKRHRRLSKTPSPLTTSNPVNPASAREISQSPGSIITPKARLRNKDSKTRFAAIESSPLPEDDNHDPSSIGRQQDSRERLEVEATMFREFRSCSKPTTRAHAYQLPKLAFLATTDQAQVPAEHDTSPSLPPDTIMSSFLGSSPTPRSSKKLLLVPLSDDGPPSSPPAILPQSLLAQSQARVFDKDSLACECVMAEEASDMMPLPDAAMGPVHTNYTRHSDLAEMQMDGEHLLQRPLNHREKEVLISLGGNAPTIAPQSHLVTHNEDDCHSQESIAAISSQSRDRRSSEVLPKSQDLSHTVAEDEEVSAQLINELTLASSSHWSDLSAKPKKVTKTAKLKRKRHVLEAPRKRTRVQHKSSVESNSQRPPDQGIVDCVLIETSSAANNADRSGFTKRNDRPMSPSAVSSGMMLGEGEGEVLDRGSPDTKRPASADSEGYKNGKAYTMSDSPRRVRRRVQGLSPIASSSPTCGEATSGAPGSEALQLAWTCGPHGSRYAYMAQPQDPPQVPADADAEAAETSPQRSRPSCGRDRDPSSSQPRRESSQTSTAVVDVADDRLATETAQKIPTAEHVLRGFRVILDQIKEVQLRPDEERTMVGMLFEAVHQVHEAGRRHTMGGDG